MAGLHILGYQTIGADAPNKATVQRVQGAIMKLAAVDPAFRALQEAVDTQVNAFGVYGPATRAAVARFNVLYGWPDDGDQITAGTVQALDRPDVRAGRAPDGDEGPLQISPAAKALVAAAQAQSAVESAAAAKASAQTTEQQAAADKQALQAKTQADRALEQARASGSPAVIQAAAQTQQAAAMTAAAKTPDQAAGAGEQAAQAGARVADVAKETPGAEAAIAAARSGGSFWTDPLVGPIPGWGVVGGAALGAILWRLVRGKWGF